MDEDDDLVIFSGAGISKPLGIPDMYEFVDTFVSKIEKEMPDKKYLLEKLINKEKIDLEELLGRLNRLSKLLKDETYLRLMNPRPDEKAILSNIQEIEEKLMDLVYEKCISYNEMIAQGIFEQLLKLKDFFEYERLKIFTTNYDICTEKAYEKLNFAYTTGFKSKGLYATWDRAAFKDPSYKMHIYKLHGSISWFEYEDQIVQLPPIDRKIFSSSKGEEFKVQMLYPLTGKEVFKHPYSELQYYLQKTLESCSMCVVIGYSFRDESINSIFSNASKENSGLDVILIDPNADEISKRLDFEVTIISKPVEDFNLEEKEFSDRAIRRTSALQQKAFHLMDSKNSKKGIEVGKRSLKLAQKINNLMAVGYTAACMSECFKDLEDKTNEKKYREIAIESYEKIELDEPNAYRNLGLLYMRSNNPDKAVENYKVAMRLFEGKGDTEAADELRKLIKAVEGK